jgi:ADP-heptose:LPS heptosyltransferase
MNAFQKISALLQRHAQAFGYVLTVILPVILKTGNRPVIFSRFAGMGDIICSLPAALGLKKKHPGATFIYNCDASSACVPTMGGVTNFITSFREIGLISFWYRGLLAGFYSFGSDDDQFTTDHREHFLQSYARQNGVAVSGEHPQLKIDPPLVEQVSALRKKWNLEGRPLILIHAGPSYPVKHWPRAAWGALVEKIQAATGGTIAQLGARAGSYANAADDNFEPVAGAVCLVNQLTLAETIALIAQADLLVGLDSGLLHIAASVGTPAVGLWGPTSAQFLFLESESKFFVTSGVECQGCHHRVPRLHWFTNCPHDTKCMTAISVAEVFQACQRALGEKKAAA